MHPLYIVWDVDPRIFPSSELLRWYGLFWALGLFVSFQLMFYIYRKEGKPPQRLDSLALYLVIGAIAGARLGHILFYDPLHYWQHPIEILPIRLEPRLEFTGLAGLASHGGVIGVLLALFLYCRKYSENYLWLLDRLVIAATLLGSFIRLGNLMNSEIVGTPTEVPWAFIFTRLDGAPRHPAQLYEAVFYMLLFVLLFILWKRRQTAQQGLLVGTGMITVFSQRFIVEFLKVDQMPFESDLLFNMGQILSIPFILTGLFLVLRSLGQNKQLSS
ncbi:prolipoprotein diacylglyceryl transferase [Cesiribacter sp. SM1]|uniref:prolipoprotein diacylglyceryl transferase n=1 Tax=Cesiribacter sp. SM1 TaxID=2861196 RepID=UPI001CD43D5F|nr:prolipoprotein diacylglyceryl transferase [Cesiribacter sp. SM1]